MYKCKIQSYVYQSKNVLDIFFFYYCKKFFFFIFKYHLKLNLKKKKKNNFFYSKITGKFQLTEPNYNQNSAATMFCRHANIIKFIELACEQSKSGTFNYFVRPTTLGQAPIPIKLVVFLKTFLFSLLLFLLLFKSWKNSIMLLRNILNLCQSITRIYWCIKKFSKQSFLSKLNIS